MGRLRSGETHRTLGGHSVLPPALAAPLVLPPALAARAAEPAHVHKPATGGALRQRRAPRAPPPARAAEPAHVHKHKPATGGALRQRRLILHLAAEEVRRTGSLHDVEHDTIVFTYVRGVSRGAAACACACGRGRGRATSARRRPNCRCRSAHTRAPQRALALHCARLARRGRAAHESESRRPTAKPRRCRGSIWCGGGSEPALFTSRRSGEAAAQIAAVRWARVGELVKCRAGLERAPAYSRGPRCCEAAARIAAPRRARVGEVVKSNQPPLCVSLPPKPSR